MYIKIVKQSLIPVILNWNWYGYKEWIKIDDFLKEYATPFESVKNRIQYINNMNNNAKPEENTVDFKKLEKKDKAKCILEVLSRENDYIIGEEYILMKPGTLKRITIFLNSMIDTAEELSKNLSKTVNTSNNNSRFASTKKNITTEHSEKRKRKSKEDVNNINATNNSDKSKKKLINLEKQPLPKKRILKL